MPAAHTQSPKISFDEVLRNERRASILAIDSNPSSVVETVATTERAMKVIRVTRHRILPTGEVDKLTFDIKAFNRNDALAKAHDMFPHSSMYLKCSFSVD